MSELVACPCDGGTLDRLIQPAILVVLADGPLHGYRLAERISELPGFAGQRPDASGVYRFLKVMEGKGLVCSSWDISGSGPAKKAY
jgi:DNA-binding PadR family transcriptional regulator